MAFADAQDNAVIFYGESPAPIFLSGTVTKGDCVGYSSGWKRALATTASVVQMRCCAAEDGVLGQTIVAYFGECKMGGSRLSGATAGSALYVAEGTASGQYTETVPDTTGDATTAIGEVLDATTTLLFPHRNNHSVA